MENIGQRIRRLRMAHGYSQKELSKLAGFADRCSVGRFETGARIPNAGHLESLSQALGVSLPYLVSGTDNPRVDDKDLIKPESNKFRIKGKPRERCTVQVYAHTGDSIRNLARDHGVTIPDLMEQMLLYCMENMSD